MTEANNAFGWEHFTHQLLGGVGADEFQNRF